MAPFTERGLFMKNKPDFNQAIVENQPSVHAVDKVDTDVDRLTDIDKLIEFEKLLQQAVDNFDIDQLEKLADLPEEKVKAAYRQMIKEIYAQTDIGKEIQDSLGKEVLLRDISKHKFSVPVKFGSGYYPEEEGMVEVGRYVEGDGLFEKGHIKLKDTAPTPQEIWQSLAQAEMPKVLDTLDHEINHHFYYWAKEKSKLTNVKKMFSNFKEFIKDNIFFDLVAIADLSLKNIPKLGEKIHHQKIKLKEEMWKRQDEFRLKNRLNDILMEVVAYKANMAYRNEEKGLTDLLKILQAESYSVYNPKEIDLVISAAQVVDRLKVLGKTDKEIAKIFAAHGEDFNFEQANFPAIDKKIKQLAESKHLSLDDVDYQVDLTKIKQKIDILKAARIAQEHATRLLAG